MKAFFFGSMKADHFLHLRPQLQLMEKLQPTSSSSMGSDRGRPASSISALGSGLVGAVGARAVVEAGAVVRGALRLLVRPA